LLELPEVALVDFPPSPDLPPIEFTEITIRDVGQIVPPLPNATVIGVVDSGISAGHPLLAAAVAGMSTSYWG
jgi:hypothetical protein